MKKVKILIADDHSVVRAGLKNLFRGAQDFTFVAEAADGEAAVRLASQWKPDVAILDISMPKLNGIEATKLLKRQHPKMKILILTIHEDEEYVYQVIRAGANGYMLKNAEKKEILSAVRAVINEEQFFSPGISRLIIDEYVKRAKDQAVPVVEPPKDLLTNREREVLQLIVQGNTSRQIAEKLFLSMATVNTHRSNLMQKLDIHDTAGLVRLAIQRGLVPVPD